MAKKKTLAKNKTLISEQDNERKKKKNRRKKRIKMGKNPTLISYKRRYLL